MYSSADHIVTVGEGYRVKLLKKRVAEDNISIVMYGVDVDVFTPRNPDKALIKQLGIEGKFVCGCVGTIGMASGLDIVIRAAKILRNKGRNDIVFVIVGDGAIRKDLESKVNQLGLNTIIFTGLKGKKVIPNYLSITDVCLVHLLKKALFKTVLPSKIFEAAAMGKPIILGVEGSAADLVNQAKTGICIEPENAKQLADAIEKLAQDSNLQKTLGQSGRNYVIKHFNCDTRALEYLQIIKRTTEVK